MATKASGSRGGKEVMPVGKELGKERWKSGYRRMSG